MASGASDAVSRRRWTSASRLLFSVTLCFMFHCAFCLSPVRFLWLIGGRRSRQMLRQRRELRICAVLLPTVLSLRLVLPLVMSREDSLAVTKPWSSGLYPGVPLSGDSVQAFQMRMEHLSQLMNSTSSSSGRCDFHQPPCTAPPHLNVARSYSFTSPDPYLFGNTLTYPSCKVMLCSPPCCLRDGGRFPLRRSFSGSHSVGVKKQRRSTASRHVRTLTKLILLYNWAWPICVMKLASPRICLPRPSSIKENSIQISVAFCVWVRVSENPNGISPCYTISYLPNGRNLLVESPTLVLIRSSSSYEEKLSSSYPLPMDRGVSSGSIPSVCFSSFIGLLSCGAVSTGSEDAIETILVVFVDEVWTSTSLYVTISQLPDFVVKAPSTHSSIVSNSLSSSFENLSCLTFINVVVYAFCLKGWIIPFFYCSGED